MPQGDAISKQPTVEEEMAKFKGFSTEDGEVKAEVTDSQEEREAAAVRTEADKQAKTAAAASAKKSGEVTDEEDAENNDATAAKTAEKKPAARKLAEYKDDETLTAAEARRMLADAVSGRLREERGRNRNAASQRDTELQELRDRLARVERGDKPETKQAAGGAPDSSKYEFGEMDVRYIKDVARYEAQQEYKSQRDADKSAQKRDDEAKQAREVAERRDAMAEKGAEKYDDFHEVVMDNTYSKDNPDGWPLSETMGQLILDSDVGPDIAYALASDVKEARRVFGLSASRQAAYFGRLEARFTESSKSTDGAGEKKTPAESVGKPVKVSNLPPPPEKTVKGKSATQPAADTQDFKAFERMAGY